MQSMLNTGRQALLAGVTAVALALPTAADAQTELKIGYMKHPIQDASLDMMEKWAKANNVKFTRVPMAYSVFMEKVTATLTSRGDQFDLIWHNDDWGQLWKKWLEPLDDVKGQETVDQWPLLAFYNDDHKNTTVSMAHTVGTFFYRSDLLKPEKCQKLSTTSLRLVSACKRKARSSGATSAAWR